MLFAGPLRGKVATELCEHLEWDSRFFGMRIAKVNVNRLSGSQVEEVLNWCRSQRIDCLYFLSEAGDGNTVCCVEQAGFALVDVRVTLEAADFKASAPELSEAVRIRPSELRDIPALKAIARLTHRDTRFYFDGHFPADLCDALYETWIEKSCRGFAETVHVAEINGCLAGYISCHRRDSSSGQIGLLGVAVEMQGKKIGSALVRSALGWFERIGIKRVEVVTQGRNIRAQRLYQNCGFRTGSLRLWYHKWFNVETR